MTVMTLMTVICGGFLDGRGDVFYHRGISPTSQFSHSSSTCPTGLWDDNLRHHGHHSSKRLLTCNGYRHTRVFSCAH